MLLENKQGFYFDEFSRQLTKNLDRDKKICVLLLNTNKWYLIKAVLRGKFDHSPGIRLMGTVGDRRAATAQEIKAFTKPLKKLNRFKGYQPLWGGMQHGRDIFFEAFETVYCGSMKFMQSL